MAPARVPASNRPLGSRLDRARLAHRDETTRSSRRHPPTSRDARSRADPAPRASRPRTVSAKNLESRFGAIRGGLSAPRTKRDRGRIRDGRFPCLARKRKETSSSTRIERHDAVALPTDDPPVFPFFSPSPTRRFFLDHLRTPPPRSTRLARAANTRPEKTVVVRLKKTAPAAV